MHFDRNETQQRFLYENQSTKFHKIHEIPSYYGDKIRGNTNDITIVFWEHSFRKVHGIPISMLLVK